MSRFAVLPLSDDESDPEPTAVEALAANGMGQPVTMSEQCTTNLKQPLFWIDLEMTGLEVNTDSILEVAMIATDGELDRVLEGPNFVIHHDESVLENMNEWSTKQHAASGLTDRCRTSTVMLADAEEALVAFVRAHCPASRKAVLAGACVYKDKEFLDVYMPRLRPLLSHRVVDVSTLRELAWRWNPHAAQSAPRGQSAHRALDDIRYSIQELRHYRRTLIRDCKDKPAPSNKRSDKTRASTQRISATAVERASRDARALSKFVEAADALQMPRTNSASVSG